MFASNELSWSPTLRSKFSLIRLVVVSELLLSNVAVTFSLLCLEISEAYAIMDCPLSPIGTGRWESLFFTDEFRDRSPCAITIHLPLVRAIDGKYLLHMRLDHSHRIRQWRYTGPAGDRAAQYLAVEWPRLRVWRSCPELACPCGYILSLCYTYCIRYSVSFPRYRCW
jgi:hypothetical protein